MLVKVLILLVLSCAAYKDYKERIIPDMVHIALILIGSIRLFTEISIGTKFTAILCDFGLGMIVPFFLFISLALMSENSIGGGDIKLFSVLGFATGILNILPIILLSCIIGLIYGKVKKENYIPMAVFVFSGTALYYALSILF